MDKNKFNKELALSIVNEVVNTLEKKNDDYGNSFFTICDTLGLKSVVPRLLDKVFRIQSLTEKNSANFEPIQDTFKDIIGYCLLSLLQLEREEMEKTVPKPCKKDDYVDKEEAVEKYKKIRKVIDRWFYEKCPYCGYHNMIRSLNGDLVCLNCQKVAHPYNYLDEIFEIVNDPGVRNEDEYTRRCPYCHAILSYSIAHKSKYYCDICEREINEDEIYGKEEDEV